MCFGRSKEPSQWDGSFEYIVGHPEPEKNSVGIFEYILASMLKVYLDVF